MVGYRATSTYLADRVLISTGCLGAVVIVAVIMLLSMSTLKHNNQYQASAQARYTWMSHARHVFARSHTRVTWQKRGGNRSVHDASLYS